MCATAWTVMVTLYGIAAASSSFNLTSAGESSPIFLDDDLPFDNANSIERVLNLLSDEDDITNGTQLASLKVEPVEHTPKARHNESNVESIPKSIGFNGSTKLRDEVAVKRVTLGNDDLTLKLIDESVVLIINGTNDTEFSHGADRMLTKSFLIAYGSQTGQAESIARQIFDHCNAIDLSPRLHALDHSEKQFNLETESLVVIVISSTGDGDPPENAARFMRRICRKSLPGDFLANTTFALLGLGDSNYSTFQGVPKKLEKQLLALGAKSLIPRGEADDQVGLELAVEPWLDLLYSTLSKLFNTQAVMSEVSSIEKITADMVGLTVEREQKREHEHVVSVPMLHVDAENLAFPEDGPCLIRGKHDLSSSENLRVPPVPAKFLISSYTDDEMEDDGVWQNGARFPGMEGDLLPARVVGIEELTDPDVKKPKKEITIDLGRDSKVNYLPGDAFYFVPSNPIEEVNFILKRLGVLHIADKCLTLSVDPNTTKKAATIPAYLPVKSTYRYIFTHCLDIRRAPGRPLLRAMADSTTNEDQKRRLLELVSTLGVHEFANFVRLPNISICDVLLAFPACHLEPERFMELLPRLMPRPYSIASYNKDRLHRIRFIYSLMTFTATDGRQYERQGLATGWLSNLAVGDNVKVIYQTPSKFRLNDPTADCEAKDIAELNIMMIGPGTGVAPFFAFLDRIRPVYRHKNDSGPWKHPNRFLFFGCRDLQKDGIHIDVLEEYCYEMMLNGLYLCESESENPDIKSYVHHSLKANASRVFQFLKLNHSLVFVCGDGNGMSRNVHDAFVDIVVRKGKVSRDEAVDFVKELKAAGRYLEDVWS